MYRRWHTARYCRLPCWCLPYPALQHDSHDYFFDVFSFHPGAFDRFGNRDAAKHGRLERR
jgi:hypothetical protein